MTRRVLLGLALLGFARPALAGSFDAEGRHHFDPSAVASESFESAAPKGLGCKDKCSWESLGSDTELALDGARFARVTAQESPFEMDLALPPLNRSYVFRVWVRHARAWVRMVFEHEGSARGTESAWLFPTGRVTSDGWVELASSAASVTGRDLTRAFLRLEGTAIDVDGLEAVAEGEYHAGGACLGLGDAVCGPDELCIGERCRQGSRFVPPLPHPSQREAVARYLASRVESFYGGRFSRQAYLPAALGEMAKMLSAQSAWQYWSSFARGVRLLHDWHTGSSSALESQGSGRRLGVCFIEGEADLTQAVWPSQAGRSDILVSHVGPTGTLGLVAGDRLVAVDGKHPVDWAHSLAGDNFGHHVATDPDVDAELVEALRDLIPRFAKSFSVIRCKPAGPSCAETVETISITAIESDVQPPSCDNRPLYHLENPPEQFPGMIGTFHYVPFVPWRDKVAGTDPAEKIFGMTFDTLYGGPGGLTQFFLDSNDFFKQNARGVILDHRAGNGGTMDAPEAITQLVRKPAELGYGPTFPLAAGDVGPSGGPEAQLWVKKLADLGQPSFNVGSDQADLELPVALLIHRDGSASDWLPHGMKGAPKVKIFGPHESAGAFSSFYQFSYWSRFDFQLASGDMYLSDGSALIGHGIAPDVLVQHTQTALLSGKDAPFEAALAWVKGNLKP